MSDTTKASQGDWETHPLTQARFEDFADVINPNRRATHCWCLSHRLRTKDIEELELLIAGLKADSDAAEAARPQMKPKK